MTMARGGLCLDIACGLGEKTMWAAQNGFEVVALDVSEVAITVLNTAAMKAGVRDRITSRVYDLDRGLPADYAGQCALVICERYRDPSLYPQIAYMAAPGGIVTVTVLSQVGYDGTPGRHHAPPGELVMAFRDLDLEIVGSIEADGLATLVARRPSTPDES